VLLVMDEHGAGALLASKVKLGADASVAAGPWPRCSAETDATLRADILSYSRARGRVVLASPWKIDDPAGHGDNRRGVRSGNFCQAYCPVRNCGRAPAAEQMIST